MCNRDKILKCCVFIHFIHLIKHPCIPTNEFNPVYYPILEKILCNLTCAILLIWHWSKLGHRVIHICKEVWVSIFIFLSFYLEV